MDIIGADPGATGTGIDTAWGRWLATPPGRYLLAWEQAQFDAAVADVFGFHAVQLGFGHLDALAASRMRHRAIAFDPDAWSAGADALARRPWQARDAAGEIEDIGRSALVVERYEDLPFSDQSIDLVVLPHVLEFAAAPHQVLREVNRVLRPEGRLIVAGFNPISLWGAREWVGGAMSRPFLPTSGRFIGLPRLRDWFELLSLDIDASHYGCYRPACRTDVWLDRTRFLERAGDRWWPICGAAYFVSAVKRVHGMRLMGPAWKREPARRARVAVASPNFAPPRSERRTRIPDDARRVQDEV